MINNNKEAIHAVMELSRYLKAFDKRSIKRDNFGEAKSATIARSWAKKLLDAGGCNGFPGCPLCQG